MVLFVVITLLMSVVNMATAETIATINGEIVGDNVIEPSFWYRLFHWDWQPLSFVDLNAYPVDGAICNLKSQSSLQTHPANENKLVGSNCAVGQFIAFYGVNGFESQDGNYVFAKLWKRTSTSDLPNFINYWVNPITFDYYIKCYECQSTAVDDYEKGCLSIDGTKCVSQSDPSCKTWYVYESVCLTKISSSTTTTLCSETDGGNKEAVYGTATFGGVTYKDKCGSTIAGITSPSYLTEYYCENNALKTMYYNCYYGCENGACKSTPTSTGDTSGTTSDGGDDGSTSGSGITTTISQDITLYDIKVQNDGKLVQGEKYYVEGKAYIQGKCEGCVIETGQAYYGTPLTIVNTEEVVGACEDDLTAGVKFNAENQWIAFKIYDIAELSGKYSVKIGAYKGCYADVGDAQEEFDVKTYSLDITASTTPSTTPPTTSTYCDNNPTAPACNVGTGNTTETNPVVETTPVKTLKNYYFNFKDYPTMAYSLSFLIFAIVSMLIYLVSMQKPKKGKRK